MSRTKPEGAPDEPPREPLPDEVEPGTEQVYDLFGQMGSTDTGRWFNTTTKDGSVGGRCARCGRLRKAENLTLYKIPFTSDEEWRCKEGC